MGIVNVPFAHMPFDTNVEARQGPSALRSSRRLTSGGLLPLSKSSQDPKLFGQTYYAGTFEVMIDDDRICPI